MAALGPAITSAFQQVGRNKGTSRGPALSHEERALEMAYTTSTHITTAKSITRPNPPPPGRLLGLISPVASQLANLISVPPFPLPGALGYFGTWAFLLSLS